MSAAIIGLTKIASINMSNKIKKLVSANNKYAFQLFSEVQKQFFQEKHSSFIKWQVCSFER